jgi:hypothetical protein
MLARKVGKSKVFDKQVFAAILDKRRTGESGGAHGWRTGEAVPEGGTLDAARAGVTAVVAGESVCGRLARPSAASPVGSMSGPFCPHAASNATAAAAVAARVREVLTRIWKTPNMWKL